MDPIAYLVIQKFLFQNPKYQTNLGTLVIWKKSSKTTLTGKHPKFFKGVLRIYGTLDMTSLLNATYHYWMYHSSA